MRDDHTLETESGAAASTNRSADVPSTDPASDVPRATVRPKQTLGELWGRSTGTFEELTARADRTLAHLSVQVGALRAHPRVRAVRAHPRVQALLDHPRLRQLLAQRGPARLALVAGLIVCLGVAAFAETRAANVDTDLPADAVAAQARADDGRAQDDQAASRSRRQALPPESDGDAAVPAQADPDTEQAAEPPAEEPAEPAVPEKVAPVAGLSRAQMDNAAAIVKAGKDLDMPRRAHVIAVATAMQESNLLNLASGVLPESMNHPNQGVGWDHDSVGLFQQRSSTGWGPIARLMDPEFAAAQFYRALAQVPGWDQMRLTVAAQTVQVSAYPEHYAKHEANATAVVDAIG